jgi:hypothetical protein
MGGDTATILDAAVTSAQTTIRYDFGSNGYLVDLTTLVQRNVSTRHGAGAGSGARRSLRVVSSESSGQELVRGVINGQPVIGGAAGGHVTPAAPSPVAVAEPAIAHHPLPTVAGGAPAAGAGMACPASSPAMGGAAVVTPAVVSGGTLARVTITGAVESALRSAVASPHSWEVIDENGKWIVLAPATASAIDGAITSGDATIRYDHCSNGYELALSTLVQTNIKAARKPSGTGVQRELRIVDAAGVVRVKGVKGGTPAIG